VKYLGDKPRGFTVLSRPSRNGRMDAGEFNSPRPSRDGSAGIHTRTCDASVRVGGSTPPDNSRRTAPKTRVLRGVAFPNCLSQRWVKVFTPSLWVSDCINCTNRDLVNLSTAFTLGVKPRGTRPAPPVELGHRGSVVDLPAALNSAVCVSVPLLRYLQQTGTPRDTYGLSRLRRTPHH